jgi:hypothetical protein
MVGNNHYTMESPFEDIEDEYENALDNKRKKDSVKLQANVLIGCVGFIETANKWLNPFDVDLDGFQEKVTDELSDYDDIFAELFEKYKGGKLAPEVQLILKLGLTSATIAFTNKIFGGNPDFNNLLKTNPNIVNAIQQEMVNTINKKPMSNAPPSMSSFLGGAPPPPIETKINKEAPTQYNQPPPFSGRPDLSMARGSVFREPGVDLENNYQTITPTPQQQQQQSNQPMSQRPEMRGPQSSQVNNILSGLNQTNFQFAVPPPTRNTPVMTPSFNMSQPMKSAPVTVQPSHTTIPTAQPSVSALKEEFKELKMDIPMDEVSISSFNISKVDDFSDNVSVLSDGDSLINTAKTPSKRGRKPRQQSEKNRISMDI